MELGCHLHLIRHENRIPPESLLPPGRDYCAVSPADKEERLRPWAWGEAQRALAIGALVVVRSEQVEEPLVTHRVDEPLDVRAETDWQSVTSVES